MEGMKEMKVHECQCMDEMFFLIGFFLFLLNFVLFFLFLFSCSVIF